MISLADPLMADTLLVGAWLDGGLIDPLLVLLYEAPLNIEFDRGSTYECAVMFEAELVG